MTVELLTVPEAAEMLRVSTRTLYELVRKGLIPGVSRVGRQVRFCRQTLVHWVTGGRSDESETVRSQTSAPFAPLDNKISC